MTTTGLDAKEKRVLNPNPYRHYRRRYSVAEVQAGAGVLVILGLFAAWVAWKGAHPDPRLYGDPDVMPGDPTAKVVENESLPGISPGVAAGQRTGGAEAAGGPAEYGAGAAAAGNVEAPAAARGPLPAGLAAPGWSEGAPSAFDASNLYEKINGRAEYFVSRGFRRLHFVSIARTGAPETAVDVELYDLGAPENALSAFNGEKPDGVAAEESGGTVSYLVRNAFFVARGPVYVRAIGTDETPEVKAQLAHLGKAFEGLAAGERPFAIAVFADALGAPSDKIAFLAENAFSFGFAKGVHTAQLPDESEAFLVATTDAASAGALAGRFERGFLDFGEKVEKGGAVWVKDRYLSTFTRVAAEGPVVVGIRGGATMESAGAALAKLRKAVSAIPPETVARAAKAAGAPKAAAPGEGGAH